MGIQSTKEISREKAEELVIDKFIEQWKEKYKVLIKEFSDEELCEQLDETFYNYRITN